MCLLISLRQINQSNNQPPFSPGDLQSTYFIRAQPCFLHCFSEQVLYESSEEIETGTCDDSGACNEFDFAEVESEYMGADVQGSEE
jgi:hypothetical protein